MLMIPIWLNGLLHQTCGSTDQIKKVTEIWDELAGHLLSISFVRRQDTFNYQQSGLTGVIPFPRRFCSVAAYEANWAMGK